MSENLEDLKTEFEHALRDLDNEIAAKDARIANLESAIKPFAEAETENEAINADETVLWEQSASGNITYGDLRTARTVLEGKSE